MEPRLTLSRLAFVSTAALLFSCASSSTGVTTGSSTGSTGTSGGAGMGSSGTTVGAGTGSGGAGAGGSDAGAVSDAPLDAQATTDADPYANWVLSWSDEFNTQAGTKPDPTYWSYDLGGGGWGLGQLQTYTNTAANAATDGTGNLAIVAIKDAVGNFTSARLKTESKFEQAYGRFETRAKVVTGNGMWPAFWMLGTDFASAGWPQCGEIDIMEVRGTLPYGSSGALHGPGYSGSNDLKGRYSLPDGGPKISDDFHTYAIEWEPGVVRFYVDNNLFATGSVRRSVTDPLAIAIPLLGARRAWAILLDDGQESFDVDGFLEEHPGGGRSAASPTAVPHARAHDNDRDPLESSISRDELENIPAAHDGHHQVEQNEARSKMMLAKKCDRFLPIRCTNGLVTVGFEHLLKRATQVGVVVNDEYRHDT